MPSSSSEEEWCQQQLANLRIAERRLETLTEIRNHLTTQSPDAPTANFLSMHDILDCLEEITPAGSNSPTSGIPPTRQYMPNAVEILTQCMHYLERTSAENRENAFVCLRHSTDEVRMLGLVKVEQIVDDMPGRPLDANIINAVIECLRNAGAEVSARALRLLLRHLPGPLIADPGIRAYLTQSLLVSDVVRCRVYDIAVGLAARSAADLESVEFLLAPLLADSDGGDALLMMNVLEFIATLAQSGHGLIYLQNNGVLTKIGLQTQSMLENPLAAILVPGYLRFFGAVATTQPRLVIVEQPTIMATLFRLFDDITDVARLPIALDTLGHLGRSTDGAILLHTHHLGRLRSALIALRNNMANFSATIKRRALGCLEEMLLPDTEPINNQFTTIAHEWYGWLTDQKPTDNNMQLKYLHDLCRNPFPDIKFAAIRLLAAVCKHGWGQLALARTGGFVEFLLDRNVDFDKEVKQEKYVLIGALSKCDCFEAHIVEQLQLYVTQGAFYVSGAMEVAVEI